VRYESPMKVSKVLYTLSGGPLKCKTLDFSMSSNLGFFCISCNVTCFPHTWRHFPHIIFPYLLEEK